MSLGVGTNLRTENLSILLVSLLLVHIISGCASVQETHGINPTDLSFLYPGIQQASVENILGKPFSDIVETDDGYSAVYLFNRGYLPYEKYKVQRATMFEFINIMTLGATYSNSIGYQKSLLHVEYDKNRKLISAEESFKRRCSNSPYAGKTCKSMRKRWLYPSTLPIQVTKLYQSAIQGDNDAQYELRSWRMNKVIAQYELKLWGLKKDIGAYCPNADLGHADAQKHIGDLYYFGIDELNIDLIRAYVWYSLAAKSGNKEASELLDYLVKELSPQQLSKAQIKLDEWEPGQCERDLMEAILEGN